MKIIPPQRANSRARGASIIELVIILPFLITIVLMVVDLGRAFSQHATLTWIAEEAVRFGARQSGLTAGQQFVSSIARPRGGPLPALVAVSPAVLPPGESAIHQRVEKLLKIEDQRSQLPLKLTNIQITSEYVQLSGFANIRNDTLRLGITGQYESLFPLTKLIVNYVIGLEGIPIRTTVDAPYLY